MERLEDLRDLQLRFHVRALIEDAVRLFGKALPRTEIIRSERINGQLIRRPHVVVAAEAAVYPLNDMNIPGSERYLAIVALICGGELEASLRHAGEDRSTAPSLLHATLIRFAIAYFARSHPETPFDEATFDTLWAELLAELKSEVWTWVRRTPLVNFTIEPTAPQNIQLAQNVLIRPIEDWERTEWDNSGSPDLLKWPALARETHLIETRYERPLQDVLNLIPPFSEDEVLLALRVLGYAVVTYRITEERLASPFMTSIHYANFNAARSENIVSLNAAECVLFFNRWQDYCAMRGNQRIAFSTRRFGDGHRRWIAEDKLVDYWAALESLYSRRREGARGVRRRLARRIAAALHPGGGVPCEQVFDAAFASYRLRSDIVHGGPDRPITEQDVAPIYTLLRISLDAILTARALPDHRALDDAANTLLGA